MGSTLTDEVYIFLYSCLTGLLIMFFYDILSLATEKNKCPLFVCNICDGIFVVVACAVMLFVNLSVNEGIVRGFEFLGVGLGALIYKLTLSPLILFIFLKITVFITSFFKIFFKILLTPIRFMYKMLSKCMIVFLCPVLRVLKRLFNHLCYRIKVSLKTTKRAIKKM